MGALRRIVRWTRRTVARAALFALLTLLAFVFVEGLCSLILVAGKGQRRWQRPVAERAHTRYDRELGWASVPGLRLADLYGPGRTLTTNSRGFRGRREVHSAVAIGVTRIVCSGDSFTLGFGVDDEDTWCRQLETLAPERETVNMGQGGYGIDQAWLWYRREAAALGHQLQLFAFIHDDFQRLLTDDFNGYGKPRLVLRAGALAVENVPVPYRSYLAPWLTENLEVVRSLRSVSLLTGLVARPRSDAATPSDPLAALPVAWAVFDDLARLNREKHSRLVLVLLPDNRDPASVAELRAALARGSDRRGVAFWDLFEEYGALAPGDAGRVFIRSGEGPVPALEGHYTVAGNDFVARALHARLKTLAPFDNAPPSR